MDCIYCGTTAQVDAANTQALLLNQQAIWCPPPRLRPWPEPHPQDGNRLWLVWREEQGTPVLLLGGGKIWGHQPPARYGEVILWTDRTIRDAAVRLGYGGGTGMCFLRLQDTVFLPGNEIRLIEGLGDIRGGLNVATRNQVNILEQILPIA